VGGSRKLVCGRSLPRQEAAQRSSYPPLCSRNHTAWPYLACGPGIGGLGEHLVTPLITRSSMAKKEPRGGKPKSFSGKSVLLVLASCGYHRRACRTHWRSCPEALKAQEKRQRLNLKKERLNVGTTGNLGRNFRACSDRCCRTTGFGVHRPMCGGVSGRCRGHDYRGPLVLDCPLGI
jgi:hypothetical protein